MRVARPDVWGTSASPALSPCVFAVNSDLSEMRGDAHCSEGD
jgi:hypothetical protein